MALPSRLTAARRVVGRYLPGG